MDTKNIKKIRAEELIGLRDHLKSCLSNLDYKNPEHRQLAIEVMELYIKRYITPAMRLPDTTIEGVIGNESLGFPLSVFFDSERKNLSRPSDEELTEALKEVNVVEENLAELQRAVQVIESGDKEKNIFLLTK